MSTSILKHSAGYAHSLNPDAEIMPMSVKSGDGLADWYAWLQKSARTR